MVEHQPRLLGSRVRFPAGAFAIFSVSAKASLPISLPPFHSSFCLFLFLSFPLPLPSTFRFRFKKRRADLQMLPQFFFFCSMKYGLSKFSDDFMPFF